METSSTAMGLIVDQRIRKGVFELVVGTPQPERRCGCGDYQFADVRVCRGYSDSSITRSLIVEPRFMVID